MFAAESMRDCRRVQVFGSLLPASLRGTTLPLEDRVSIALETPGCLIEVDIESRSEHVRRALTLATRTRRSARGGLVPETIRNVARSVGIPEGPYQTPYGCFARIPIDPSCCIHLGDDIPRLPCEAANIGVADDSSRRIVVPNDHLVAVVLEADSEKATDTVITLNGSACVVEFDRRTGIVQLADQTPGVRCALDGASCMTLSNLAKPIDNPYQSPAAGCCGNSSLRMRPLDQVDTTAVTIGESANQATYTIVAGHVA